MHLQWMVPFWAWPILLTVAVGAVLWARRTYAATEPAPQPGLRRLLVGLRSAACLLVLLAAARPLLVSLQVVSEPALIALVVEDSGSMALHDEPGAADRWSRSWRLVAAIDSVLSRRSDGPQPVFLRGNGLRPLRETTPDEALQDRPAAVGTALPRLVMQARQSLLSRPLRAMVVLSDGHCQDVASPAPILGVPLWMVGVGDITGPPDRHLADLRYPDRVQRGEEVTIEVAVGLRGGGDGTPGPGAPPTPAAKDALSQEVTVHLHHDGRVVDTRTGPGGDLTRWELGWVAEETGLAVLEVEVAPLDNERFLANNRATLAVDVLKDRSRVLVLAPAPGWDLRFLVQAARLQPRLEVSIVRPAPAGPVLAGTGQPWRAPVSAAQWRESWDAVLLIGPPGALLPDSGRLLAEAVHQGLGLLVIAGDPGTDARPRPWPRALQAVLPVTLGAEQPLAREWPIGLVPDMLHHPILDGVTHGGEALDGMAGWPPLRSLQIVRPRPPAQVILQTEGGQPLLAVAEIGDGRSLWFGGRRLWELAFWRLPHSVADSPKAGAGAGGRLLQQMLLWTALGDRTAGITLLGQQLIFEEGEFLPLAVRWIDLRGEPVTGRSLAVEAARPDGSDVRVQPLVEDPSRPGISVGELPPLPPGPWNLTPRSTGIDPLEGPAHAIMVTRAERESAQVLQDWRNLRQAAARLGGAALDSGRPEHLERLLAAVAGLDLTPQQRQLRSRNEPASGWTWLAIAVALLSTEWLLRRRHGLL